jgi:protein arginine kinase activator
MIKQQQTSINDVLHSFLSNQADIEELARLRCPECGMSFVEFRNQGVLGCAHDYDVFGEALTGIIERAQDGRNSHVGKTPGEVVRIDPVQQERLEVQRELRDAVEREDYERAAELRDRLGELAGE